jgi:hypothetical protein
MYPMWLHDVKGPVKGKWLSVKAVALQQQLAATHLGIAAIHDAVSEVGVDARQADEVGA